MKVNNTTLSGKRFHTVIILLEKKYIVIKMLLVQFISIYAIVTNEETKYSCYVNIFIRSPNTSIRPIKVNLIAIMFYV